MIIDDEENNIKAIYIKIPKTGGTTISSNILSRYNQIFTPKFWNNNKSWNKNNKFRNNFNSNKKNYENVINLNLVEDFKSSNCGWHVPYFKITEYLNSENKPIEEYTKFSIIREPVSRFISQYRFLDSLSYHFSNAMRSIDYYFDFIYNNDKRMKEYDIVFSRKQTYWLNDENGLVPEDMKLFTTKTMNDKKTIDYLNDVFNLKFNTKNRINVSNKFKKIKISSELRSKIENYFSEDCELYEKTKNSLK
tara:strand:+ start:121 stop:867 length:747 start_codon:yes stop_codon:yes gene_type:complete